MKNFDLDSLLNPPKKITYKKLTRELCKRFKTKWPIGREEKFYKLAMINHMVLAGTTFEHVEFASEHDRMFFEQHPDKNEYTRQPIPGESPGADLTNMIIVVTQHKPGIRNRQPVEIYNKQTGEILQIPKQEYNA